MSEVATAPAATAFPKAAVETALRAELSQEVASAAAVKGIAVPAAGPGLSAFPWKLDSLRVVEVLCVIEPIVGFELKDELVKTGGYDSIDHAVVHLIPRIEKEWTKQKGGKK